MIWIHVRKEFTEAVRKLQEEGRMGSGKLVSGAESPRVEVSSFVDPTVKWPDIPVDAVDSVSMKDEIYDHFRPQGVYEAYGATLSAENKLVPGRGDSAGDSDIAQTVKIVGPSVTAVQSIWTEFRNGTLEPTTRLEPKEKDNSDLYSAIAFIVVLVLMVGISLRRDESRRHLACVATAWTTGYVSRSCSDIFEHMIFPLTSDQKSHLKLRRNYYHATAYLRLRERELQQIREDGILIDDPTDKKKAALAEEKLQEQIAALRVRRNHLLSRIRESSPRFNREMTVNLAYYVLEHSRKLQERPDEAVRRGWQYVLPSSGAELEKRLGREGEFIAERESRMKDRQLKPTLRDRLAERSVYDQEFEEAADEPMEPLAPGERLLCESALAQLRIINEKLQLLSHERYERERKELANDEKDFESRKKEKEVMKLVEKVLKSK